MLIYIVIIIIGIILDQTTKFWASSVLSGMTTYPIIPNVLHFTYVENTGAAFNTFTDMQLFLIVITLVFIIILGYLFYLLPKTKAFNLANLALSLMLSGALGNLIDRINLSYVIDFIDLRIVNFAVFNVADALVVAGAMLLFFSYLKNQLVLPKPPPAPAKREEATSQPKEKKLRKDVLKDLKPKRNKESRNAIVKTEIVHLKSEQRNKAQTSFYNDFTNLNRQTMSEEKETHQKNRYDQQSDSYAQSIEKIRELNNENLETRHPNRFTQKADEYESSIKHQTREGRQRKSVTEWNPQISGNRKAKTYETTWNPQVSYKVQSKKYESTWNPEHTNKDTRSSKRYEDQISRYASSIQSHKNEVDEAEIEEVGEDKKPNRYQKLSDDYLESIEQIKNKHYTED